MMSSRRLVLCSAVVAALLLSTQPRTSGAADVPYWPSDCQKRLSEVDAEVLEKMRDLSAARLRNDDAAVASLSKQFKELQEERVKLLRATGQLPPR